MSFVRAYMRASTEEQDAARAKAQLQAFAKDYGIRIASWYVENESGAKLDRPELFRLLQDSSEGDVLLVEQVDRLSRLNAADWETLKARLGQKRIRVVALDLPTSWQSAKAAGDDATQAILDAVNRMLLDVLAVVARKDYTDRRRRQAQGIEKAKTAGLYRGRQVNQQKHADIRDLLARGLSWSRVCEVTGASRSTVLRVVNADKATT